MTLEKKTRLAAIALLSTLVVCYLAMMISSWIFGIFFRGGKK